MKKNHTNTMKSVFRCRVLLCFAVSSACAGRICRPFYGLCLPVYFPLFYLFLISHTLVFLSHSRFSPLASSFTQQLCPKVTYTFLCSCLLSPPFPPLISSCHVVLSSHVDPSLEDSSSLPLMWTFLSSGLFLSSGSSFHMNPLSSPPPSQPASGRAAGTSVKMGRRYCCYLNL